METNFIHTSFQFAGMMIDGFKMDGEYFLSQTQISKMIGKDDNSFLRWINSVHSKKKYGEVKPIRLSIPGQNHWKVFKTEWAVKYLLHWTAKGEDAALELVEQLTKASFDVMIENSIKPIEAEKVNELIPSYSPSWKLSREYSKSIHAAFVQACKQKGHPGAQVHDYITMLVCGQTASDARENNPLIGEDETIGLDHQPSPEDLETIANIKLRYAGLTKGTWKEQVERAYKSVVTE